MLSFSQFVKEAWTNEIDQVSKEKSVTSNDKYNSPKDFKKDSKKVGEVNGLEIHSAPSGDGLTHFTWNPKDRKIHHVVHAVDVSNQNGKTRLKWLSAHGRKESPVRMGQVYSHLVKNHNIEFVGTGHSPGAQKMWQKFHSDPELEIHGHDPVTGETKKLTSSDVKYAPKTTKDSEEKKIGRMNLILKKKD